jgi:hypothetical protein
LGSRKHNEKSPEEAAPTRGRILHINRYFIKISRLNQEKPCNLAGWPSPGHQVFFFGYPESENAKLWPLLPEKFLCRKMGF